MTPLVNFTDPLGVPSDDLTVVGSVTLPSTFGPLGLADTFVVVEALLVWVAADAIAGMARTVQAAAATAVADTSRPAPAPRRWPPGRVPPPPGRGS